MAAVYLPEDSMYDPRFERDLKLAMTGMFLILVGAALVAFTLGFVLGGGLHAPL
jgi:hypothetical protein